MSTSQYEKYCDWCGQMPLVEFNTKTGEFIKLTKCGCDDDSRLNCVLDGLKAIVLCTDEDPIKIAKETLEAYRKLSP